MKYIQQSPSRFCSPFVDGAQQCCKTVRLFKTVSLNDYANEVVVQC